MLRLSGAFPVWAVWLMERKTKMAAAYNIDGDEIEIMVPCKAEYVRTIRRTVAEFAESMNMSRADVEEVEIAASEAVANVIRHAYNGCTKIEPVRVKCSHKRNGMTIEVTDKGCGFSAPAADAIPSVNFDREGGLGIILIKTLMDRVIYVSKPDEGTKLNMTERARRAIRDCRIRTDPDRQRNQEEPAVR